MTKCILFTRPDGGVSVVHPVPNSRLEDEPEEDWLARVIAKSVPSDAADVQLVDAASLPSNRTFRNAWTHSGGRIGVRMDQAREAHRGRIRAARKPLLEALDIEAIRAIRDPAALDEVEARKQALRDATAHPDIETAQTPEELAAVWPLDTPPPAIPAPQAGPTAPRAPLPNPVHFAPLPDVDPQQPPGRRRQRWVLGDLLAKAAGPVEPKQELPPPPEPPPAHIPAPPVDDSMRRRWAKVAVMGAVDDVSDALARLQPRYELALQAHNGNVQVMEMMEEEAKALRIDVKMLAERIIVEQRALARRMSHCHALKAQVLAALNEASGDEIGRIEQDAIAKIRGT